MKTVVKTKWLRRLAAAGVFALAGMLAAPEQGHAETVWKMQSFWQAGSINQKVFERFCENVNEASGGRLIIEPLPVKAVVAHNETLDAVAANVLQGHQSAPVYFSGRDPAFGLIGDLNAGYENPYQMWAWFYERGGLELARELYAEYGLYFVGPIWWGVESMPFKERYETLASLEGVKMRMPEGPSSDIFRKIGAAPANIPGADVYTSLERGVIDGTDWGTLSMNEDLGFHKIAKFPIYPGIHSMPVGDVSINMDEWNALPDDLKKIVELAVSEFSRDMIQTMAVEDLRAREAAVEEGVTLVTWSDEERKKLRSVAQEVWKEYSEGSDIAKKVYDSQVSWLQELGLL